MLRLARRDKSKPASSHVTVGSCAFDAHKIVIPTGASAFSPIWCSRCGCFFDASVGQWVKP